MNFKQKIINACLAELENKLQNINEAMHSAQGAANEEEKSTAGDKHDTARAMSHLETEMNGRQLNEALQQKSLFSSIDFTTIASKVGIGSYVQGGGNHFLIAVGLGVIEIESKRVAVCSPSSPIAQSLLGKKIGEEFVFGTLRFTLEEII
jgi:transcription elongation GreA/GreB family factor